MDHSSKTNSSVNKFEDEVDQCVKNNYKVFLEQAMENVRKKYPHLDEERVKYLAIKVVVVVKENFKLNESVKREQQYETCLAFEDIDLSDGNNLRKKCLKNVLKQKNARRALEKFSTASGNKENHHEKKDRSIEENARATEDSSKGPIPSQQREIYY